MTFFCKCSFAPNLFDLPSWKNNKIINLNYCQALFGTFSFGRHHKMFLWGQQKQSIPVFHSTPPGSSEIISLVILHTLHRFLIQFYSVADEKPLFNLNMFV